MLVHWKIFKFWTIFCIYPKIVFPISWNTFIIIINLLTVVVQRSSSPETPSAVSSVISAQSKPDWSYSERCLYSYISVDSICSAADVSSVALYCFCVPAQHAYRCSSVCSTAGYWEDVEVLAFLYPFEVWATFLSYFDSVTKKNIFSKTEVFEIKLKRYHYTIGHHTLSST